MASYDDPNFYGDDPIWFKKYREKTLEESRKKQAEKAEQQIQREKPDPRYAKKPENLASEKPELDWRDVFKAGKHVDVGSIGKNTQNNKQEKKELTPLIQSQPKKRSPYGITMPEIAMEVLGYIPEGVKLTEREERLKPAKPRFRFRMTDRAYRDPKTGELIYYLNIEDPEQ